LFYSINNLDDFVCQGHLLFNKKYKKKNM